ncbi:unnamed protein product [Tuber aestivum]|uniref:Aminoglycoside phosphotransferase domain-containing protein n=1 Tax=Tuber aestivum TaxID=59557 RepID=A0A292PJI5_9PEZI|nr:unnamed protein product [Tuber aestivum]
MRRVAIDQVPIAKVPPRVPPLTRFPNARRIYCRNHGSRQIFDLGNRTLYKFRPHKAGVYESDIHALIQATTDIPIPIIYNEWVTLEHNGAQIHHLIMEKVEGEPLHKVWVHLDRPSKERLALQLSGYLNELRRITSPSIRAFDGGPLHDEHGVLFDGRNSARGPFGDNQSLWLALTSHLQESPSGEIQQALINLRSIMPQGFPAVLTHADLHQGNILVHNRCISAIIDWEGAGFFPCWLEYVRYYPTSSSPEFEFEILVMRSMETYPVARRFMTILDALRGPEQWLVNWAIRELGC